MSILKPKSNGHRKSDGRKSSSVLPTSLQEFPSSESIPVLNPNVEVVLARLVITQAATVVALVLLVIAFFGVAFKPVPDLVIANDGTPQKTKPITDADLSEPQQVIRFLENRLPILYTWVGVVPNPNDPTGTTFIKDDGLPVSALNPTTKKTEVVGRIPTSVFNEQFILSEAIRESTLAGIAALIAKTNGIIWQTTPENPNLGVSYRFVFRARPQFPTEVEPGRWKVVVNADIVRVAPTLGIVPSTEKIQAFNFDIYVRRAGRGPSLFLDDRKDIVAYGKSSGFEIDAMIPFSPQNIVVPSPK